MRRSEFTEADDGKAVSYQGRSGKLEFPLTDPGCAEPGEGIIWFDDGSGWQYVSPDDVKELP